MNDVKNYYLDNGLIIQYSSKGSGTSAITIKDIFNPNLPGRTVQVEWKVVGSQVNALYFYSSTSFHRQRLQRATFAGDGNYTVDELNIFNVISYELRKQAELNFPYYCAKKGRTFEIRSFLSENKFVSTCPLLSNTGQNTLFVYRNNIVAVGRKKIVRYGGEIMEVGRPRYRDGVESLYEFSEMHLFRGKLIALQNSNNCLFILDVTLMIMKTEKLPIIARQAFTCQFSNFKRPKILFITSTGIAHIEGKESGVTRRFAAQLNIPEDDTEVGNIPNAIVSVGRPVHTYQAPIAVPETAESGQEIAELTKKNSSLEQRVIEQEKRIADLERKYRQLLMMIGRIDVKVHGKGKKFATATEESEGDECDTSSQKSFTTRLEILD